MSLLKPIAPTPALVARNRRNARKSTGPHGAQGKRNVALNRLTHGLYATPHSEALPALGEDPNEFEASLRDLMAEWQPDSPTQHGLVRRLAKLFWKQRRIERAEEGMAAQRIEALSFERDRRAQGKHRTTYDGIAETVELGGLRRVKDAYSTFHEILAALRRLLERARQGEFDEGPAILRTLFGRMPSWRSSKLAALYARLASPPRNSLPSSQDDRMALERLLEEEINAVEEEFELFRRRHSKVSPAQRDALLMPTQPEWALSIRQESSLGRQIDQILRFLLALKERKKTEGDESKYVKVQVQSQNVVENKGPEQKI